MGSTTFGVKIDDELRARLKAAAEKQGRTPHWLIKQALLTLLDRVERGEVPSPARRGRCRSRRRPRRRGAGPQPPAFRPVGAAAKRPAREDHLRLSPAGGGMRAPPRRRGAAGRRPKRRGARPHAGRGAARQGIGAGVEGLMHEYLAVEPGRRGADVPRRGAAAHSRRRDARRADPRQDRAAATGARISGDSPSLFVNAATWGLVRHRQAGRHASASAGLSAALTRLIARGGEPVIRTRRRHGDAHDGRAVRHRRDHRRGARARRGAARRSGFRYSYDMLGEAATTAADAAALSTRPTSTRSTRSARRRPGAASTTGPGISIKLSALHPRYQPRAARPRDGRAAAAA